MKLTSNYVDLLFEPRGANAEWCEFIAGKIRGIVDDPDDGRAADPAGPPLRREAPAVRHRLLRGVQRPERVAGRPPRDADRAGDRDRASRRPTACASSTSSCGPPASTSAPARYVAHGHPGSRRPRAHRALGRRADDVPRRADRGFPNLFFPGGPHAAAGNNPRYNGDQVDFVTDVLVLRPGPRLRRHRGQRRVPRSGGPPWSTGARRRPPFGEIGQYFGGNIPGKPRRYLLNTGGRPKLFEDIADGSNDSSFDLTDGRSSARRELPSVGVRRWRPGSGVSRRCRAGAAAGR